MRTFGRTCRGLHKVVLKVVRQTERQLLEVNPSIRALCLSACLKLEEDSTLEGALRERLHEKLLHARAHHQQIEAQSRRLVSGKKLPHAKLVNAYDLSIAPILKGKSNCPAQFGKKPGIVAEMATGFIFGLHLPQGNPDDASYLMPLLDKVDRAIARMEGKRKPRIVSVAADLAFRGASLRNQLHAKGILTVGIPDTIAPVPALPAPDRIPAVQEQFDLGQTPSATQVKTAYICGYSRPFVESLIETLSCRGGAHIKYKGHRGSTLQITTAILACNAAALVRIQQGRLTRRAQKFRRFFRLRPPNLLQNNDSKN
jgi:hypothetical protein